MKIINDGLPQTVFDWLSNDEYTKAGADISVTELIDSPRIRVLKKRHDHEIEINASTLLASFLGKAVHSAIEKATQHGTAERRLSILRNGWKVSGAMDHYHDGELVDYKTANVWKTVYADGGRLEEFERQLNVYAQILRENHVVVDSLKIFMLFKDWNKRGFGEAFKKGKLWAPWKAAGYPTKDWAYFSVPLWTEDKAKRYIDERVKLHQTAEKELPLCTGAEIWRGQRCTSYCSVANFCEQYQNAKKTGLSQKEE